MFFKMYAIAKLTMISGKKNMKTWKYEYLSLKRRKTFEGKKSQIIFDK